ncbi:MAG TPA: hypothetical protein VHB68_03470 [Steroidobacteraceae bacterium]|nr:hypothetical protein [Steroidobacteraceae bacterium]
MTVLFAAACAGTSQARSSGGPAPGCDTECLSAAARSYWSALLSHDAGRLKSAPGLVFTENNVVLRTDQGLWQTIGSAEDRDIVFTDVPQGTVATTAVITEGSRPALLLARLKVAGGAITEIETVVARKETSTFLRPEGWYESRTLLTRTVAPASQRPRPALIAAAEDYFNRIVDPSQPMPPLDPQCNRIENGLRTTNNPDPFPGITPPPLSPAISRLGCEEQFQRKALGFISRVRDRRYVLVDEPHGVVLSMVMFDHDGVAPAQASPGQAQARLSSPLPSPYSFVVAELFKIEAGKIVLVQALLTQVPYGLHTAW